ncbi:uncharacterized protein [Drosophila takahashii]|uniref:uncharacterized protein n=1 Tax=Drosophila takahashii TaxID=29030 RepID=UPI001CF88E60|nr:uncharacterized protein LOC108067852 [Drosophila takahashii]
MEFLDPALHSIDEVYAQFKEYQKKRQEQQMELENKLKTRFDLDADFRELNAQMEKLNAGLDELDERQKRQLRQRKTMLQCLDVIEPAPQDEAVCSLQEEDPEPKQLLIKCGVSKCLFEDCQRRVNSQLLLLHYLCDHNHKDASFQRSLPLLEGERTMLSLQPKTCEFRVNKVLGLLAYRGQLNQQRPREIPVVVLICRTAAHASMMRSLDSQRQDVFVLWLVTPSDRQQLNATLRLCGRDAAARADCVVGVQRVIHSQDADHFMTVDENYWQLTYAEVEKLSNNFRDELHLEVSLTEAKAS